MKVFTKAALTVLLSVGLTLPYFAVSREETVAVSAEEKITTTATGYTKASDVKYDRSGNYKEDNGDWIANWGARGEDCVFLSSWAEDFYTGSYVYDTLSQKSGNTSTSKVPSSALYSSLKTLMTSKHTNKTSYGETKYQYRYTDCVSNNHANISSFYSGRKLSGAWDSAATWNREHTWPKSKSLNGNSDGGDDEADVIMLRPTWVQENNSRRNTAYGEGSGYFDPGISVRGDCARIALYVYVRWGNTNYMWGKSGVMESMSVLLDWMEEDPVDTWEMARNDVVQDITGTRNVFVDYPEYAWLLFGQSVPKNITTPSGEAKGVSQGGGSNSSSSDSSSDSVGDSSSDSSSGSANDSSSSGGFDSSEETSEQKNCTHEFDEWFITLDPTETEDGMRVRTCEKCGKTETEVLPKLGDPENGEEEGGLLSGCGGSIGLSAAGILLLSGGAFVLAKRKE